MSWYPLTVDIKHTLCFTKSVEEKDSIKCHEMGCNFSKLIYIFTVADESETIYWRNVFKSIQKVDRIYRVTDCES